MKRDRDYYMSKLMELSVKEFKRRHRLSAPVDLLPIVEAYGYAEVEHFVCVYLDASNSVITAKVITKGLLSRTLIHPVAVFRPAIELYAASVILCHNHPSCVGGTTPEPSREDKDATKRLVDAGKLLGIQVLDHLILGQGTYYSFKESDCVFLS